MGLGKRSPMLDWRRLWEWIAAHTQFWLLWCRGQANRVLRLDSLRRRANQVIDRSLGSRGRLSFIWYAHPRWITVGLAGVAIVISLLPWPDFFGGWPHFVPRTASLITVIAALLVGEAALFALTAAITALLVNIGTNRIERSFVINSYRSRAFDAAAVMSVIAIGASGYSLIELLRAEALNLPVQDLFVRTGLLFGFDVVALAWLLVYAHVLITEVAWKGAARLVPLFRDSFRETALQEVSEHLLREWAPTVHLAFPGFGQGFSQELAAVRARKSAYLYDVSCDRLTVWLHRLEHRVSPETDIKAVAQLRLNAEANQDDQLAAISQADASRGPAMLDALRWKTLLSQDVFPEALGILQDNASSSARNGRLADFRSDLAQLQSLLVEEFRLIVRAETLQNQWLTHLLGWQPAVQLNIALHRLGADVLGAESTAVISAWLYFPQKVLRETRHFRGRELRPAFDIWQQAAGRALIPPEWGFWLRLTEYTNSLDMALARATTTDAFTEITREAYGILHAYRGMIVALDSRFFGHVAQRIEKIGEHLLGPWSVPAGMAPLAVSRRNFASQFTSARRVFWLGYAGWAFRQHEQNRLSDAELAERWQTLTQQYNTLDQLWWAWRTLGDNDPFQWDWEQSRERLAEAEARGHASVAGFVEPFASSTLPFILLGLITPGQVSHDDQAHGLLQVEIQPRLQSMVADGPAKWKAILGEVTAEWLTQRIDELRERIAAAEN